MIVKGCKFSIEAHDAWYLAELRRRRALMLSQHPDRVMHTAAEARASRSKEEMPPKQAYLIGECSCGRPKWKRRDTCWACYCASRKTRRFMKAQEEFEQWKQAEFEWYWALGLVPPNMKGGCDADNQGTSRIERTHSARAGVSPRLLPAAGGCEEAPQAAG